MESKEYFEKVMQDFNQNRNGNSLRKYCMGEGIDYKSVFEYKKGYPPKTKKVMDVSDQRLEANNKQVARRGTAVKSSLRRCLCDKEFQHNR